MGHVKNRASPIRRLRVAAAERLRQAVLAGSVLGNRDRSFRHFVDCRFSRFFVWTSGPRRWRHCKVRCALGDRVPARRAAGRILLSRIHAVYAGDWNSLLAGGYRNFADFRRRASLQSRRELDRARWRSSFGDSSTCLTLRLTGNLWFAVGFHTAGDWAETFLFSVSNSGTPAKGQLLSSTMHGPAWLTGGTVGPEASVFSYITVLLFALVFYLLYRKPGSAARLTQLQPSGHLGDVTVLARSPCSRRPPLVGPSS